MDQAPVQSVDLREGLDNTLIILHNKLKSGVTVITPTRALPSITAPRTTIDGLAAVHQGNQTPRLVRIDGASVPREGDPLSLDLAGLVSRA